MSQAWTTNHEKKFIEQMGSAKNGFPEKSKAEKLAMLVKYIDSLDKRSEWGEIDKNTIRKYARAKLRRDRIK